MPQSSIQLERRGHSSASPVDLLVQLLEQHGRRLGHAEAQPLVHAHHRPDRTFKRLKRSNVISRVTTLVTSVLHSIQTFETAGCHQLGRLHLTHPSGSCSPGDAGSQSAKQCRPTAPPTYLSRLVECSRSMRSVPPKSSRARGETKVESYTYTCKPGPGRKRRTRGQTTCAQTR